jgi:hypothetical protein
MEKMEKRLKSDSIPLTSIVVGEGLEIQYSELYVIIWIWKAAPDAPNGWFRSSHMIMFYFSRDGLDVPEWDRWYSNDLGSLPP